MNLQDMTDLITVYDGSCDIEEAFLALAGCIEPDSPISKIDFVSEVILRNSVLYNEKENWEDSEVSHILDSEVPAEERA